MSKLKVIKKEVEKEVVPVQAGQVWTNPESGNIILVIGDSIGFGYIYLTPAPKVSGKPFVYYKDQKDVIGQVYTEILNATLTYEED